MEHCFGFSSLEECEPWEESSIIVYGDSVGSADAPFNSIVKYGEAIIIPGAALTQHSLRTDENTGQLFI